MPSFGDTALIALLALLLFGPKKLPELARQLGKLMGEFRRASNEFRMQMEDELRVSEKEERQKKIAAMEAAAPVPAPVMQSEGTTTPSESSGTLSEGSLTQSEGSLPQAEGSVTQNENGGTVDHLYTSPAENTIATPPLDPVSSLTDAADAAKPDRHTGAPLPIATAGELAMMPPSTGLPQGRSPLANVFDSIPQTEDPDAPAAPSLAEHETHEASLHG